MLGADPPRRPPHRAGPPSLERSKSCQGPSRRKRNREVLEDITWIVNNDLSSWSNTSTASSGVNDDGVQLGAPVVVHDAGEGETDLDEPEEPSAGPSSARVLDPPQAAASASTANSRLTTINTLARARSETFLPSLDAEYNITNSNTRILGSNSLNSSSSASFFFNAVPPQNSLSRTLTNLDSSSSPPSSPHASSSSRYAYGLFGQSNATHALARTTQQAGNAGLGLGRTASLPLVHTSNLSSTSSMSRRASNATPSPSLRAPPPLRRTSSSSSISSMDGSSQIPSAPSTSSSLLAEPFTASRALTRANTMPVVGLFGSLQRGESIEREGVSGRLGPIPLILREMPSPERKRTRRIVDDDEDDDEEEDDEDDEI